MPVGVAVTTFFLFLGIPYGNLLAWQLIRLLPNKRLSHRPSLPVLTRLTHTGWPTIADVMSIEAVYVEACRLRQHPKVSLRITQLQNALAERRAWDRDRLVDELETNLQGARQHKQMSAANGALQLIGKATGLLTDVPSPQDRPLNVTKVTIVLNHGERQSKVVEGTGVVVDGNGTAGELTDGGQVVDDPA